jgi:hypothetical protein
MVALRWDRATGFTALIQFGDDWTAQRLPVLKDTPIATMPQGGYDGQFYAQLAVEPDVLSPDLQHALDNPAYRSRRILLPVVAHVLGGGRPGWVLNIYALLNVAAWLALAWVWWREVDANSPRGAAIWLACMLSLGALDSVRLSLTDLPAMLALVLAVLATQRARPRLAAGLLLAGGFVRETCLLAAGLLRVAGDDSRRGKWRTWLLRGAAVLPVILWCGWLRGVIPGNAAGQNFAWPGVGLARHLYGCAGQLGAGDFDSRYVFGLLGALGLAYQSIFVLQRWRHADAWTRLGLPFAALFWLLSAYVFSGYWAAARACLPLTFAYNRMLPNDRAFWPRLILANLAVLHALWRMLP